MAWCDWCGGDCVYSTEMCRIEELLRFEFIDVLDEELDDEYEVD
jgi:hypothetical protein